MNEEEFNNEALIERIQLLESEVIYLRELYDNFHNRITSVEYIMRNKL
jgi:hypothetical protein